MRRIALLGASSAALFIVSLAPSAANAAFTQCPPVSKDTSCQFLITVTDSETTVASDPSQGPYEGIEDALIGVQNNTSKPLSSIPVSAEASLFGFEHDGICSPGTISAPAPRAPGCVVLNQNKEKVKSAKAGEPCPATVPTTGEEECGFEPVGEPEGLGEFPAGVEINGFAKNGDPITGYEGPTSYFTKIGSLGAFSTGSGVVNFTPAIPVGGSTYFSLESPPTVGFGSAAGLTTSLSAASVVAGTAVTDSAKLTGENSATGTGKVTFRVYSDPACTKLVVEAGAIKMAAGAAGPSTAQALAAGKYYWQASYSGDLNHQAARSTCGSEVLTVLAPTTTSTLQSGGGISGQSIIVPVGTPVTDTALVGGPLAASSTGTVTYILYKDSKCTIPAAAGSAGAEAKGTAAPSAPVKLAVGTYYWQAAYGGDALNAPSASGCAAEVLTVAKKAKLGLSTHKGCVSNRRFTVHPHAPRGVKLASIQEYINGTLIFTSKVANKRETTVNLRGFPKGTYKVELVATDSKGNVYEDTRTFHTCVTGHHKKHKKHKK